MNVRWLSGGTGLITMGISPWYSSIIKCKLHVACNTNNSVHSTLSMLHIIIQDIDIWCMHRSLGSAARAWQWHKVRFNAHVRISPTHFCSKLPMRTERNWRETFYLAQTAMENDIDADAQSNVRDFVYRFHSNGSANRLRVPLQLPYTRDVREQALRLIKLHRMPAHLEDELFTTLQQFAKEASDEFLDHQAEECLPSDSVFDKVCDCIDRRG